MKEIKIEDLKVGDVYVDEDGEKVKVLKIDQYGVIVDYVDKDNIKKPKENHIPDDGEKVEEINLDKFKKIAIEVEKDYQMGGLSGGLYEDYALDILKKYLK